MHSVRDYYGIDVFTGDLADMYNQIKELKRTMLSSARTVTIKGVEGDMAMPTCPVEGCRCKVRARLTSCGCYSSVCTVC
jgi:hypothetical protein